MLNLKAAKERVEQHINSLYQNEGDDLVVLDEETIEKPYGWIFFYQSRRYLETGNYRFQLAGNGPIVVDKNDESLTPLGTALPFEDYLEDYERKKVVGLTYNYGTP